MGGFFHELKRRNVVRVGGAYAVVGWLLVQVATTLEESMNLPAWFDGLIVALLLIGLPIVLIFSWAFELTPDGVVRTEDVPESESITPQTGRKLDYVIVAGLVILDHRPLVGLERERQHGCPGVLLAARLGAA